MSERIGVDAVVAAWRMGALIEAHTVHSQDPHDVLVWLWTRPGETLAVCVSWQDFLTVVRKLGAPGLGGDRGCVHIRARLWTQAAYTPLHAALKAAVIDYQRSTKEPVNP